MGAIRPRMLCLMSPHAVPFVTGSGDELLIKKNDLSIQALWPYIPVILMLAYTEAEA